MLDNLFVTSDKRIFTIYNLETKEKTFTKESNKNLISNKIRQGQRPPLRPLGIDCDDEYIFVASHENICAFDKLTYNYVSKLDIKAFVNTHQIIKDDNIFYVVNSCNDSIGIFDLQTGESKYIDVRNLKVVHEVIDSDDVYVNDKHHVNSILIYEGKLYYCLHNKGQSPSVIGYFDLTTNDFGVLFEGGLCLHNMKILSNHLYTLSSGTGELIKINMSNKNIDTFKLVNEDIFFLRGLDIYNENLLIAHSSFSSFREQKDTDVRNSFISHFNTTTEENSFFMQLDTPTVCAIKVI